MEMRRASAEKIYEAVFDGILSNLDIYSRYAGSKEAKKNRAKRSGFGGIGVRFHIVKNLPQVTFVMPDTPAQKAGILNDNSQGMLLSGPVPKAFTYIPPKK